MLKITAVAYGLDTAEITVRGNILQGEVLLKDLPIVRIMIERIAGGSMIVDDTFCCVVPELKPIKSFRLLLELELRRLISENEGIIRLGAKEYLRRLIHFSETKVLVDELTRCVNKIKPENANPDILRKVLAALNKSSAVENQFEVVAE